MKPSRGRQKNVVLVIVWLLLLVVFGGTIFFRRTEQGKQMWDAVFTPADPAAAERIAQERAAAAKLEARGVLVTSTRIQDGDENFENDVRAADTVNLLKPEQFDRETIELISKLYYLRTLNLGDTAAGESDFALIRGLRDIASLVATNTKADDAALAHIGEFRNMQSLYLAGTDVTNEGLPKLHGLQSMKILDLSRTKITDEGLKHLTGFDEMAQLLLNECEVTEAGLTAVIKEMDSLSVLSLKGVGLDDEAAARIEAIKPQLKVVH